MSSLDAGNPIGPEIDVFGLLAHAGLSALGVSHVIAAALAEDSVGALSDVLAAAVPNDLVGTVELRLMDSGIIAGLPVAALVFAMASQGRVRTTSDRLDGSFADSGSVLMTATGPMRDLLTAQRCATGLLARLCAVATLSGIWAAEVLDTGVQVRATEHTTPGLRALEHYAVRCGVGLDQAQRPAETVLTTDLLAAAGSVTQLLRAIGENSGDLQLTVQATSAGGCAAAVEAGARSIVCVDMAVAELKSCVAIAAEAGPGIAVGAGGDLELAAAAAVARTGVSYLAVPALTQSAHALKIGFHYLTGQS